MKVTVTPRSDQWNADDFTGGPRTFTIAGVKHGAAEAKYDIELAEGEGRVWRPPNGMLSVLIQLWGDDAQKWQGRRVTLFKDASVRFGKEVPGGIRISHMSDIGSKPCNPPITVSRGKKSPYKVLPLIEDAGQGTAHTGEIPAEVQKNIDTHKGTPKLEEYFRWLTEQGAPAHILNHVSATLEHTKEGN